MQNPAPANQAVLLEQPGIKLSQGGPPISAQQQQGAAKGGDGSGASVGDSSLQATQGQGPNPPALSLSQKDAKSCLSTGMQVTKKVRTK